MAREGRIQSHKSSSAVDLPASKLISSKSSSRVAAADVKLKRPADHDNNEFIIEEEEVKMSGSKNILLPPPAKKNVNTVQALI